MPETIDEYIAEFPMEIQEVLKKIRAVIREAAPGSIEKISYRMPAFSFLGKNIAYFAAFKNHIGFYPTPQGISEFEEKLSSYKRSKGGVQFPIHAVPYELIGEIVAYKVKSVKEGMEKNT
ncbi:DUF1801 domain-containing protein [Brucepastera parasyntrophica]|uniref:iron chaperone n=1 Tax=Brucepastera parasyntrophica TaxID=2880008 RepID=UPI00210DA464|nr:DUF1801 domain-containing protein [Brucepastera parasyntrophica]ULQ59951.1 DUF1801 domain-containing protein [Brucepastera parasyntrophica]